MRVFECKKGAPEGADVARQVARERRAEAIIQSHPPPSAREDREPPSCSFSDKSVSREDGPQEPTQLSAVFFWCALTIKQEPRGRLEDRIVVRHVEPPREDGDFSTSRWRLRLVRVRRRHPGRRGPPSPPSHDRARTTSNAGISALSYIFNLCLFILCHLVFSSCFFCAHSSHSAERPSANARHITPKVAQVCV